MLVLAKLRGRFSLFDKTGLAPERVRSMRLIVFAVMGGIVWSNITAGVAMTGYMKLLGASDFLYGIVIALSPIASAFQFLASYYMERTLKRRKLFLVTGFIQRAIWIPFALIPFIIPASDAAFRLFTAVLCVVVSATMAPFMNVSFYSFCADVIPMRIRGSYFAVRSRISTCAALAAGLITGAILDKLPGFTGYLVVFMIAGVAGVADISCFVKMWLPEMEPAPVRERMLPMFNSVLNDRNYMRTVMALTLWNFALNICSPYFNVYMHNSLGMSNFNIMILSQIAANIFLIAFVSRWGRAIDEYGSRGVMRLSAICASFVPILFICVGRDTQWLVFAAYAVSGGMGCAVELGAQNIFMGQAREGSKSMYIAMYFAFTQLAGLALGSAVGGWLLDNALWRLEALNWTLFGVALTRYNYLYMISGALRLSTALFVLPVITDAGGSSTSEILASEFKKLSLKRQAIVYKIRKRRALKKYRKDPRNWEG